MLITITSCILAVKNSIDFVHSIRKTLLTLTNREISIDNIEKKLVMFFQIKVEVKMKEWTQMKTIWKMEKNLSRVTKNK